MTVDQKKRLVEIGKWVGAILTGLLAGGGGAIATTRAQADSELGPRVVALEFRVAEHEVALKDIIQILRGVDRNVSEMRGEMKHMNGGH